MKFSRFHRNAPAIVPGFSFLNRGSILQPIATHRGDMLMGKAARLRGQLVKIAIEWEDYFGVAPRITSAISELDAARLVGMREKQFCEDGRKRTAVTKGLDFEHSRLRYQITANRPSGKSGSFVTLVSRKTEKNGVFGWDRLIWILYDRNYRIQEAWQFTADQYRKKFSLIRRLSPKHMRLGKCLYPRKKTMH